MRAAALFLAVAIAVACSAEVSIEIHDPPGMQATGTSRTELGNGYVVTQRDGQVWVNGVGYGPVAHGDALSVVTAGTGEGTVRRNGEVLQPVSESR